MAATTETTDTTEASRSALETAPNAEETDLLHTAETTDFTDALEWVFTPESEKTGNNEWYTPTDLVDDLKAAVGGFDLDPCAGAEPFPIAEHRYTKRDDGLAHPWFGKVFCNPPYERFVIDQWAERMRVEYQRAGGPELVIGLVPARCNTDWWHEVADDADLICLLDNRLRFGNAEGTGRYPYALIVYADFIPDQLIEVLEDWGKVNSPQESTRLRSVGVESIISIDVDDGAMGCPAGVDSRVTAIVQTAQLRDDDYVEVLAVQPAAEPGEPETYFLLRAPPDEPDDVRCAAESTDLRGWKTVPIDDVTVELRSDVPPARGYVC